MEMIFKMFCSLYLVSVSCIAENKKATGRKDMSDFNIYDLCIFIFAKVHNIISTTLQNKKKK